MLVKAAGSLRQKRLANRSIGIFETEPPGARAESQPVWDPAFGQPLNPSAPLMPALTEEEAAVSVPVGRGGTPYFSNYSVCS